jgi:hypothetical protein
MKARKAAVVFIFVTVMLDMLALGLIAPVLPKLVLNFLGGDATSAAKWFGIFGTVFALMQFSFRRFWVFFRIASAGARSCSFRISGSVSTIWLWPSPGPASCISSPFPS